MRHEPTDSDDSRRPTRPERTNFWPRRIVAIFVDWLCCYAISFGFFDANPSITLAIFVVSTIIMQASIGTTLGHRIVGLGTRREDGSVPGLPSAAIRTAGLCLLLPPIIVDAQGRGLHERWSGTHIVRLGAPRR